MFKYDEGVLPQHINNLFSVGNERHNCNTRHNQDMQINTGNGEIVYKLVRIINPKKFQLINHTHVLRT